MLKNIFLFCIFNIHLNNLAHFTRGIHLPLENQDCYRKNKRRKAVSVFRFLQQQDSWRQWKYGCSRSNGNRKMSLVFRCLRQKHDWESIALWDCWVGDQPWGNEGPSCARAPALHFDFEAHVLFIFFLFYSSYCSKEFSLEI